MPAPEPLTGIERVRRKPGMYIGGTDAAALSNCVLELIANSIEQHLYGRCFSISVTIHEDGSVSVADDGPGISVAVDPVYNASFLELALTTQNYSLKDHLKRPYHVLGGAGVGVLGVNAVS